MRLISSYGKLIVRANQSILLISNQENGQDREIACMSTGVQEQLFMTIIYGSSQTPVSKGKILQKNSHNGKTLTLMPSLTDVSSSLE